MTQFWKIQIIEDYPVFGQTLKESEEMIPIKYPKYGYIQDTGTEKLYLNVGTWQERSVANGPGERFVLLAAGLFHSVSWLLQPGIFTFCGKSNY